MISAHKTSWPSVGTAMPLRRSARLGFNESQLGTIAKAVANAKMKLDQTLAAFDDQPEKTAQRIKLIFGEKSSTQGIFHGLLRIRHELHSGDLSRFRFDRKCPNGWILWVYIPSAVPTHHDIDHHIAISEDFFNLSPSDQVNGIIHECAHIALSADDVEFPNGEVAYHLKNVLKLAQESADEAQSPLKCATNNADSWSYFVHGGRDEAALMRRLRTCSRDGSCK